MVEVTSGSRRIRGIGGARGHRTHHCVHHLGVVGHPNLYRAPRVQSERGRGHRRLRLVGIVGQHRRLRLRRIVGYYRQHRFRQSGCRLGDGVEWDWRLGERIHRDRQFGRRWGCRRGGVRFGRRFGRWCGVRRRRGCSRRGNLRRERGGCGWCDIRWRRCHRRFGGFGGWVCRSRRGIRGKRDLYGGRLSRRANYLRCRHSHHRSATSAPMSTSADRISRTGYPPYPT